MVKKVYVNLKQVKSLIDEIFEDKEIIKLLEKNILPDSYTEDLQDLFFAHQNAEIPFLEDGPIVLDDDIYEYIDSKYDKEKVSIQVVYIIEYQIYSLIFMAV